MNGRKAEKRRQSIVIDDLADIAAGWTAVRVLWALADTLCEKEYVSQHNIDTLSRELRIVEAALAAAWDKRRDDLKEVNGQ